MLEEPCSDTVDSSVNRLWTYYLPILISYVHYFAMTHSCLMRHSRSDSKRFVSDVNWRRWWCSNPSVNSTGDYSDQLVSSRMIYTDRRSRIQRHSSLDRSTSVLYLVLKMPLDNCECCGWRNNWTLSRGKKLTTKMCSLLMKRRIAFM